MPLAQFSSLYSSQAAYWHRAKIPSVLGADAAVVVGDTAAAVAAVAAGCIGCEDGIGDDSLTNIPI